jgi:hypothetical protein
MAVPEVLDRHTVSGHSEPEAFIGLVEVDERAARREPAGGPRILGLAELEETRDRIANRIADVRGLLTDRAHVETANRDLLEEMIAEPERFHWLRISNEDIGEPGCRHWHSRPRYGIIGMLMGWWRVKLSSGCPLAMGRRGAASPPKSRRT